MIASRQPGPDTLAKTKYLVRPERQRSTILAEPPDTLVLNAQRLLVDDVDLVEHVRVRRGPDAARRRERGVMLSDHAGATPH